MNATFLNSIHFIRKLTIRKIWNYLKLKFSYYFTLFSGKYFHSGNPFALSLELTNNCNLRCPECPVGLNLMKRPKGFLKYDLFVKIIDEAASDLIYLTLYFQGEPFLNKDIFRMIQYANKKNIYTFISTNAQLIDHVFAQKIVESGLNKIIISIDGTTQETYEKYRIGGQLSKVIAATKSIAEWKQKLKISTPYIVFQFLVTKDNEHQINEINKLAKSSGADAVELKTLQIVDLKKDSHLIPTNTAFSRYKKQSDGTLLLKKQMHNSCFRSWSSMVFTWDGMAVPCCFDKDAEHPLGSAKTDSIKNIFSGKKFHDFRKQILKNRRKIEMCRNCNE